MNAQQLIESKDLISNIIEKQASILNIELKSNITSSFTDYGNSTYFYVLNANTNEQVKVRISDHDATNSVRQANEMMFCISKGIETIFNQIEKVTNPERFTITLKQVQYGKNLITIKEYKKN